MAGTGNGWGDLAGRCGYCGSPLAAKTTRRRFCGDPCRWAAWKRAKEEAARAPVERALRDLVGRLEDVLQEAREALAGQKTESR